MNAADEDFKEQRRRPNAKKGHAHMGAEPRVRRYSQRCHIGGEGQQKVKQTVLELRLLHDLDSHPPSDDDLVHHPNEAQ